MSCPVSAFAYIPQANVGTWSNIGRMDVAGGQRSVSTGT